MKLTIEIEFDDKILAGNAAKEMRKAIKAVPDKMRDTVTGAVSDGKWRLLLDPNSHKSGRWRIES